MTKKVMNTFAGSGVADNNVPPAFANSNNILRKDRVWRHRNSRQHAPRQYTQDSSSRAQALVEDLWLTGRLLDLD